MKRIKPIGEDIFYPAGSEELADILDNLIKDFAPGETIPTAILPPHAAYRYAGKLMAETYAAARSAKPDWILLAAPVHGDDTEGIFLPDGDVFETPLGDVPLCTEHMQKLVSSDSAVIKAAAFLEEPALELQLPFIRRIFPEVPVLPLYVGGKRRRVEKAFTSAIKKLPTPPLTIITTNLSDFEQRKFSEEKAKGFVEAVNTGSFNPREYQGIANYLPCGQTILNGYWDYLDGNANMSLINWGSDNPEAESNEKCTFYGGFRIDKN